MNATDIQQYLDALALQAKAEASGDQAGAERAAHRAASLFFVMTPRDQTVASQEARRLGLSK